MGRVIMPIPWLLGFSHTAATHAAIAHAAVAHATTTAHSSAGVSVVIGDIGIPIFTGALGNLASEAIKYLIKKYGKGVKKSLKIIGQADEVYHDAANKALQAFLEYQQTGSRDAYDRYIDAYAKAQIAFNFHFFGK